MNHEAKVKIIKGEGIFPTPEVRKIYPTKALLWKYYFTMIVIWALVAIGTYLFTGTMSIIGDEDFPQGLLDISWVLFWVGSIIIIIPAIFLLPIYVNRMEYIVHGDEIVVAKGLINRTVKYCPFRTVTNISTRAGPFDRLFGIGNVFVQTAGQSGATTAPEEKLEGLPLYHEIRDYILKRLRVFHTSTLDDRTTTTETVDSDSLQREIIDELREIKHLLDKKVIKRK